MSRSTLAGWDTTSDSVKPRKPLVGASDARKRTRVSEAEGGAAEGAGGGGVGHLEGDRRDGSGSGRDGGHG